MCARLFLARLEKKNRHLAKIEVNEVFCLVGHVRTEVATNDAVPCGVVLLVELLLDIRGNVLANVPTSPKINDAKIRQQHRQIKGVRGGEGRGGGGDQGDQMQEKRRPNENVKGRRGNGGKGFRRGDK